MKSVISKIKGAHLLNVGDEFIRIAGNAWSKYDGADLGHVLVVGSADVSQSGDATTYHLTTSRGPIHVRCEIEMVYVTAGQNGSSPLVSGNLPGQTGETAEQRLAAFLSAAG